MSLEVPRPTLPTSNSGIHVTDAVDESPRKKPPPDQSKISSPFFYAPSSDGTDENLLILLHGLGDTLGPFSKLGKQLNLPQTAIIAIQAPEQIPYIHGDAFQWYPSFTPLGELVENPNPSKALELLSTLLDHLTSACSWPAHRIHLFGFAQGGSVAAELAILLWKRQLETAGKHSNHPVFDNHPVGSVITVSGPLLSYPTLQRSNPTPVLIFHRSPPSEYALPLGAMTAFEKGFEKVTDVVVGAGGNGEGEGMPKGKNEWRDIMRFWSEHIGKRQLEGVYEVRPGA